MDDGHFDALARSLTETRSRRGIARLLGGLALVGPPALLRLTGIEARKKGKKKKKTCQNGETRCDGDCVDLQNDPEELRRLRRRV